LVDKYHKHDKHLSYLLRLTDYVSVSISTVFSQGHFLLSYVCNRLSAQSTQTLLCVGDWSLRGLIKDSDVKAAVCLPDVEGEELKLEENWDKIHIHD
jgi:hypothetical protein